jgi:hypothetical protein
MAGSTLVDDLRNHIQKRDVLVVIGAGVSIGATKGNAVASWTGLLEHGLGRCHDVCSLDDLVKEWLREFGED